MIRTRAVAAILAAVGPLTLLGPAAQAAASVPARAAAPAPPPPPVHTPDTSSCPNRMRPPPPVDLSEVPAPGRSAPTPRPVPDEPVGGPRMGHCGLVLPVDAPPLPQGITAASWLIADLGTGEVLAAKDPHGRHRPASTIKLLTALLAADHLAPEQVVTATQTDADQEGSSVGLGPGGQYTVRQLLTGLLLASGNDAAHALAGQFGGVDATVRRMNELAEQLGARDTYAATPSGLDGPGMSTSAYDLALIFGHVLSRPLLAELLTTLQVPFPGFGDKPGYVVSNDNKLLINYEGALGGKTGFTDDARHTYVGGAVRHGRPLVVVLLRGEQRPLRMWQQAALLLDYGFGLPRGNAVGTLIRPGEDPRQAAEPAGTPTRTTTAPTPAPPLDSGGARSAADAAASVSGPPHSTPSALVIAGWLGAAVLAGSGLTGVLIRQRNRANREV